MSTANNKEPKYRPALSLPQVRYLQSLLENAPAHEATAQLNESIQLSFKLLTFRVSIGATTPAYKAAGKESIEDKLGLGATKEEQLVSAYQKFEQWRWFRSISI